jgi:16S rRNA (guanine966-N2)-methyltransferase
VQPAFAAWWFRVVGTEAHLRIIAGIYRSRPLASLPGMDIRPTSDRLRETLFNVLCAGNPEALQGSTWLDLYAGTGAVGIEALSRGAGHVTFVESTAKAVALIEKNLRSLRIDDRFQVIRGEVGEVLRKLETTGGIANYIFLDPPYRLQAEYKRTLGMLGHSQVLRPGGIVIVEHSKRFDPGTEYAELRRFRKLEQGDAALSFYRK